MGHLGGWTKLQLSFQTGAQISLRIQQTSGTVARFTPVRFAGVRTTLNATMLASKYFEQNLFFFLVIGNYAGKWESTNCFKNLGYICKMPGGQNVKPTSAPGEVPHSRVVWLSVCMFRLSQTSQSAVT